MANSAHSTPAPGQQPELRPLIVHEELPHGCFAFEIDDQQTAPHVRRGEFVAVDGSDLIPVAGELFVCAFSTRDPEEKILRVMEVSDCGSLPGHFLLSEVQPQWLISLGGLATQKVKFMDGPYPPAHLTEKLFRGKVVGIYEPDFRRKSFSVEA